MTQSAEDETRVWLAQVVVGLNLCPFAKGELATGRVRIVAHSEETGGDDFEGRLQAVAREIQILDNDEEVGTSLLVFPHSMRDFERYLLFLEAAEEYLQSMGYEGTYQLASFHPDYRFAESDAADAANYTNRSPYPTIHFLREREVARALDGYPNPEAIPERNKKKCRELGIPALSALTKSQPR
jgi:hypothetical protein